MPRRFAKPEWHKWIRSTADEKAVAAGCWFDDREYVDDDEIEFEEDDIDLESMKTKVAACKARAEAHVKTVQTLVKSEEIINGSRGLVKHNGRWVTPEQRAEAMQAATKPAAKPVAGGAPVAAKKPQTLKPDDMEWVIDEMARLQAMGKIDIQTELMIKFTGDRGRIHVNRGGVYGKAVEELLDNPLPEDGFSFKTGLFSDELATVDRLQGRHTEDDAFLYLRGADDLGEFTQLESALLALRTQYGGLKL